MRSTFLGTLAFFSAIQVQAGQALDSIPDVPDQSPIRSLGKYNYAAAAISYAKKMGLPEPKTVDAAFDMLARQVLETCDDGQQIELADSAGGQNIPDKARQLLKKFCDEQDIKVAAIPDLPASMQVYAKRWSCQITKLRQVKKLMSGRNDG